jgi:hypothetical protein
MASEVVARYEVEASGQFHALAAFVSGEIAPGIHWIRVWASLKAGLYAVEERQISFPYRESNPPCPARSRSVYGLSYRHSLHHTLELICTLPVEADIQSQMNI